MIEFASESKVWGRSSSRVIAFFFTLLGGIAATIILGLSLFYQHTVTFPYLQSQGQAYLINYYLLLDFLTLLGGLLMYLGAIFIIRQLWWPIGTIFAFLGAIISVAIISIILGVVGGIINLFNRPRRQVEKVN